MSLSCLVIWLEISRTDGFASSGSTQLFTWAYGGYAGGLRMSGSQVAYATPVVLSLLACVAVLVLVARRRRSSEAAQHFTWMMLGEVGWCAGYLGELLTPTLSGKLFWDGAQVLPSYVTAVEGLLFAQAYVGRGGLRGAKQLAVWMIPAVHVAFVWTAPWHHVLYPGAHIEASSPFGALLYGFTPLDWFGYIYACLVMLATLGVMLRHLIEHSGTYRAQLLPVLVGMSMPLVSSVLLFAGVSVLGQRDSMPYAFAFSAFLISRPLLRERLFDLLPIAHGAVIAATPEAVLVIDAGGRIVEVNPAMKALIRRDDELLGQALSEAIPWAAAAAHAGPWEPVDIELSRDLIVEARGTDLNDRPGRRLGRVLTFHDVTLTRRAQSNLEHQKDELERRVRERTRELELAHEELKREVEERKNTERQLAQAQKMESLGRLAGGVAHDFNNLLTAILGNVELTRLDLPEDSALLQNLDEIQHASESAQALVRQLLVFGRKHVIEVMSVDLRQALTDSTRLLRRLLGEDVQIQLELPPRALHARLDPMQFEQVIVNLAVNARDAMPRGGRLTLALAQRRGSVQVTVSDTGVGMAEDVRARVFEPFFTTKPVGKGTGLGLSLVFAVVRQSGGNISVDSELGKGTSFVLEFPEAEPNEAPQLGKPSDGLAGIPGGTEKVVLVEDQRELSRFAQRTLRKLGYTVLAFASAEEALAALAELADTALLFSDVVLPGMSGPDLAERLASQLPRLRVLFASGYHEESLRERSTIVSTVRVLAKPFTIEQLASAIRETLDAQPPSSRDAHAPWAS